MIHHGVRLTVKPGIAAEDLEAALESLRNQGRVIPSVKSFVVGRDFGGDFEWGAMYVIEDLDGYWEYLMHPAHAHSDEIGLPLVDRFESFDITDDSDPELGEKIAELHRRRFAERPELTEMVTDLASYQGSGAPAKSEG
jgi:hypothetical protein